MEFNKSQRSSSFLFLEKKHFAYVISSPAFVFIEEKQTSKHNHILCKCLVPLILISTFDIVVEWISILSSKFLISLFKIDATVTQSSCYYYPRRPPCTFIRVWTYSRGRHSFISPHVIPVFVDLIFWFTFLFMWYARGPRKNAMKEQFMNYLILIADDLEGIYHSLFRPRLSTCCINVIVDLLTVSELPLSSLFD